jgi:hypothetical protein
MGSFVGYDIFVNNSNYIRQYPEPMNIVYIHWFRPDTDEYMGRPV